MKIKTKLTLIFSFFITLIILLTICLISCLFLQRIYFVQYVDLRDKTALIGDITQLVNSQKLHFDYYILLNEEKEKENFLMLRKNSDELVNSFISKEKNDDLKDSYNQFVYLTDKVFNEKNRERKINIAADEVLPTYESLIKKLKQQLNIYQFESKKIQNFIFLLNLFSWLLSILVIVFASIVILKYGVRIYRSLSHSLSVITKFANILSRGEYKEISETTDDEFNEVYTAFNLMVNNLKRLQTQIIQMDRLSNIGQLAGGIAHELNNPLVGVLGQAQILLEQLPQESPLRVHIEKIERAAKRCREIVAKLLQFSRQKEYEYTESDINEVVQNVLLIADSELKAHNIEVVKMFQFAAMPKIKISVPHIQQALLNIINNAIQAMETKNDTKNMLIIKTYTTKLEENNMSNEYVVIEIQDTGCGIEKENLNLIFEPFFTTKDREKFAGVGLTITKDIILHHKGKISVFSEGRGKGAKFTIYLPLKS